MIDHPLAWYTDQGVQYLLFGEGMYGRFYREPTRYPTEIAQYDDLFSRLTQVQTFPEPNDRVTVRVYKIPSAR
jgi:hypothetical protein